MSEPLDWRGLQEGDCFLSECVPLHELVMAVAAPVEVSEESGGLRLRTTVLVINCSGEQPWLWRINHLVNGLDAGFTVTRMIT